MIVVTGSGRSGTSFVCSLIQRLGGNFGDESQLLKADQWNPSGYFENIECLSLNIQLISGVSIRPYLLQIDQRRSICDRIALGLVKLNYLLPPAILSIQSRGVVYAEAIESFSQKYSSKVVKDPRFCLTLREWRTYGNVEKAIFCIRHPHEVALSLARQYRLPIFWGYRFWMNYTQEFFKHSKGLDVLIIDFNKFFSHKNDSVREMQRLCTFWGKSATDTDIVSIMAELKKPSLKHHHMNSKECLPQKIGELYESILSIQED